MKIKILGTRGEIEKSTPRHSKKSGILIDESLLLDLGEKEYLKTRPRNILITHFHPDHAFFVRRGYEEKLTSKAPIFGPEKRVSGIKILNRKKKIGSYQITPIPTHHSKNVKSQAYLIQKGDKAVLYTGDLVWIDKKYQMQLKKLDLVITEASFIREGGMIRKDPETKKLYGHAGIPNLIRLFRPYTEKICFVHFGSWFYENPKRSRQKFLALGKKYGLEVLVAHDGMRIEL